MTLLVGASMPHQMVYAGNPDRAGQAGAPQLLMNPWARQTGWNSLSTACVSGLEAERINVAGMAFDPKLRTEVALARTQWLKGTDISINALGIAQRISESAVLGFTVVQMSLGDLPVTTENQPDGGLGTFSPKFTNIGISYSKVFSKRIYGGVTGRIVSEGIADVKSTGFALDAGIQYATGKYNQTKFGISLRNVGLPMRFSGDGLAVQGQITGDKINLTLQQRSERFELPSLMNIGMSYDFLFAEKKDIKVTLAGNFTSNSFTKDRFGVGAEFNFKSFFMVRAGYSLETSKAKIENTTNAYTGLGAGASVDIPLNGEKGTRFGVDYSYKPTNFFGGTNVLGIKLSL